ncbi:MAG: cell division ATP-binding protein FtsE [Arenicella sp.]
MKIEFSHVNKNYGSSKQALNDVSFVIPNEEMVFVTGHSGAGKSTLLKLISLIERPTSGQILVNDRNLSSFKNRDIPFHRRNIGVVFQENTLIEDYNVFRNVAMPLEICNTHPQEIKKRVNAALDKVGLLNKSRQLPSKLSAGEHQRVGIARAIVSRPALLLADEPTGNLDSALADDITDLFAAFNQVGITVIIATHDNRQLKRFNHPVIELQDGQISQVYQSSEVHI